MRFGVTAPRQVSDEKKDDSLNVLASLTKAGVATGSLVTPSFVGDVTSSCELEQFQQDWFVQSAHADQVPVANLTNLGKVTIAVLDSGIDYTHEALRNHVWDGTVAEDSDLQLALNMRTVGIDFTGAVRSNDITDRSPNSHGTHVAGIASGAAIDRLFQSFNTASIQNAIHSDASESGPKRKRRGK